MKSTCAVTQELEVKGTWSTKWGFSQQGNVPVENKPQDSENPIQRSLSSSPEAGQLPHLPFSNIFPMSGLKDFSI